MSTNAYVGLAEAADILGTTKQTVRNWSTAGLITVSTDADILAALNAHKSGRPHEFFYYRDQLEQLRKKREAERVHPDPETYIRIDKAAKALCITPRTLNRLRTRQSLQEFIGTDGDVYLLLTEVAAQQPGVTYRTAVHPDELRSAAKKYGLTAIRKATIT